MKKIVASILAIAMIASMFTMVFSADTEKQTNYSEYTEILNDLIDDLLAVGPQMLDEAVLYDANRNDAYQLNNSDQRIANVLNLGGSRWTATVFGELARFDERFAEIEDYYEDLEDYEDALEDWEDGKLFGAELEAPVYPYGVDVSKLFPENITHMEDTDGDGVEEEVIDVDFEAEFIKLLNKSDAMNAVAQAWGYENIADAVANLYYAGSQVDDADMTVASRTAQFVNWKDQLPAEIVSYHFNSAGKKIVATADGAYSKTGSLDAVVNWLKENAPDLLPTGDKAEMAVEYSNTLEVFDMLLAYVASAARFSENADAEWFSAEFNANRTIVYKTAIQAAKDFIAALRSMVTAENCPYEEELALYTNFATVVNNAAAYDFEDVYNASYGINPYPVVDIEDAYGIFDQVGILGGYQWFSFAEIAAHSEEAAQLLTSLQAQLRAAALFNVNGVLYAEFAGKVEELYGTFEALCWELVAPAEDEALVDNFDYIGVFKAVVELLQVEALYTLYVEDNLDLYSRSVENISLIYNLTAQIDYARAILAHVGYSGSEDFWNLVMNNFLKRSVDGSEDTADLGYWIDDDDFDRTLKVKNSFKYFKGMSADAIYAFVDNIEANIAALVPASGQQITASELAEGLALYKKAGNLLSYYANYTYEKLGIEAEPANSNIIPGYDELKVLYDKLSNIIPSNDGVATAVLPFDIIYVPVTPLVAELYGLEGTYKVNESDSHELQFSTYAYTLEYTPVAYNFLSLLPDVEEAIETMEAYITKYLGTDAPSYGLYPVDELYEALQKYDFLTMRDMIEDGEKLDDEDTRLYFYMLTGYSTEEAFLSACAEDGAEDVKLGKGSFLATVIGDPEGDVDLAYDYAVRNFAYFYQIFDLVRGYYATEWDLYEDYLDYVDGDRLDFSNGNFSILDVDVVSNEGLLKYLIAELDAAATLLCVNATDRVAMFQWVNEELKEVFEFNLDNATYSVNENATGYGVAANYVEGELANLAKAMTALNQLIDGFYQVKNSKGQMVDFVNRATPAKLEAAYEAVVSAFYKLLTVKGAACADVYFAQIDLTLAAKVYGNKNSVADVKEALDNHVVSITKYFPGEAELRPYEYFALTLRAIANDDSTANLYSLYNDVNGASYFYINFYKAFDKAVAGVNAIVTGQYPTALREDAAKLAFFVNDIYDGVAEGAFPLVINPLTGKEEPLNWNAYNMPLWYALELTAYLQEYVAAAKEQHSSALNALKAEVLVPVVEEAEAIQTAFLAAPGRLVKAYDAAQLVLENIKDGALYIYDAEEIQAAADALAATVELAKAELGDAVYTVEDVLALIDAILVTVEARATGLAVDLKDLRVQATDAKTEIAAGAYNQANIINKLVVSANAVLKSLANVKLEKADAYTPASYAAYEAAYNTLMDVVNVEAEVELTVAEALAAYEAAKAALVTIEEATGAMYDAAVAALEAAKAVDGTKYTAESYAAFEAAVAALEAAIANYASDVELQAAIVAVKVAEVQLVAANVGEVGTLDD